MQLKKGVKTLELQLDENTFQQAIRLSAYYQWTLEELFAQALDKIKTPPSNDDPLLGLFSEEPELIDEMVESVMQTREKQWWRYLGRLGSR